MDGWHEEDGSDLSDMRSTLFFNCDNLEKKADLFHPCVFELCIVHSLRSSVTTCISFMQTKLEKGSKHLGLDLVDH